MSNSNTRWPHPVLTGCQQGPQDISICGWRPSVAAPRRLLQRLLLATLITVASGCESITYYSQAISGQLAVTFARQPVTQLLAAESTPTALKQRLQAAQRILRYAEQTLGLPSGRRYQTYVALEQNAVLYNLVATPALSVTAHQWCYPIAGCAPYRGYFKRAAADASAQRYLRRGFTTYVGRVPAYSTLGWFADPLLSSFIHWNDAELMALLVHELSHSRAWVDSDVAFNEAFATFVGERATRDWLRSNDPELLQIYNADRAAWLALVDLQQQLKVQLGSLYAASGADAHKRTRSKRLYAAFRDCYASHLKQFGEGRYDAYVEQLNDAALAALATYREDVPAFAALFVQQGGQWQGFFDAVDALAALSAQERKSRMQRLRASGQQPEAQAADHQDPHQVQCQALAHHGVNGHVP